MLFLGRFSPEKGCHVLIEAFERIETDLKLVLAGGASYCDAYTRDVLSHASDRIHILSWVAGQDLDELLTNAMLFVLPSEMEGLSLALLDAMGAGICVLASDIAENREAVEGAGFTFRCGNVADLADRLRFLIDNAAIREAGRGCQEASRRPLQLEQTGEGCRTSLLRRSGLAGSRACSKEASPTINRGGTRAPGGIVVNYS